MLRSRNGMALVLALLAVSFLVAVTVQLNTSVNWQLKAASNQRKTVQLDALLLSGLSLARAALLSDQQENNFDTVFDDWSNLKPETIAALSGGGDLRIKITDLSGRLQVNALVLSKEEKKRRAKEKKSPGHRRGKKPKKNPEKMQRQLWKRFLLSGKFSPDNDDAVAELLDTLADWLDENNSERDKGAEQGYYRGQNPPYDAANGPLMFVEELFLVKGWSRKLLLGDKEHAGIIGYLTTAGEDGKININTAPALLLQALSSDMTEDLAADLIEFRSDEKNKDRLKNPGWYRQVSGFPGNIIFAKELITTSSNAFRIQVTAFLDGLRRSGTGIILRRKTKEQVLLYWKVE